jgi:hypothetical protein
MLEKYSFEKTQDKSSEIENEEIGLKSQENEKEEPSNEDRADTKKDAEEDREKLNYDKKQQEIEDSIQLEKIRAKIKEGSPDKNTESGNFRIEKIYVEKLINSTKKVSNIFNKRSDEKLNLLIDEGNLGKMQSSISKIEDIFGKKEFSADGLSQEIKKINESIESIGTAPRGKSVKENVESLTALCSGLKTLGDEARNLSNASVIKENEDIRTIRESLWKLDESCKKSYAFVARSRASLENFFRGR